MKKLYNFYLYDTDERNIEIIKKVLFDEMGLNFPDTSGLLRFLLESKTRELKEKYNVDMENDKMDEVYKEYLEDYNRNNIKDEL